MLKKLQIPEWDTSYLCICFYWVMSLRRVAYWLATCDWKLRHVLEYVMSAYEYMSVYAGVYMFRINSFL